MSKAAAGEEEKRRWLHSRRLPTTRLPPLAVKAHSELQRLSLAELQRRAESNQEGKADIEKLARKRQPDARSTRRIGEPQRQEIKEANLKARSRRLRRLAFCRELARFGAGA